MFINQFRHLSSVPRILKSPRQSLSYWGDSQALRAMKAMRGMIRPLPIRKKFLHIWLDLFPHRRIARNAWLSPRFVLARAPPTRLGTIGDPGLAGCRNGFDSA